MKRRFVVGVSAFYHESSVALFENGRLVCYLREEWLSRIKGDHFFPRQSINYIKDVFCISDEEVEAVCYYEKPLRGWLRLLHHGLSKPIKNRKMIANHLKNFWDGPVFVTSLIQKYFKIRRSKIFFSNHHLSHALSALHFAPTTESWAVLVVDGVGDGECAAIYDITSSKEIKKMWSANFPNSLGLFYSAITDFLGFFVNDGEYQIMALASYGEPVYADDFFQHVVNVKNGNIELNSDYFDFESDPERSYSSKMEALLGPSRDVRNEFPCLQSEEFKRWANIAASAQVVFELCLEKLIKHACNITGKRKLLLSGGTALNCVAVSKAHSLNDIDIFVPPSPGDAGASIGAGVFAATILGHKVTQSDSAYAGPLGETENNIMPTELGILKKIVGQDQMIDETVRLLAKGEIVATRFGKMEVGPRALGHRSLICDASSKDAVNKLNIDVKKRASFRPIAPIVHAKFADKYFEVPDKARPQFQWMGSVATARQVTRDSYAGICHVDNSARLQIIDNECPIISELLLGCAEKGIYILANTSFNIAGDPVVFDEIDAFVSLNRMGLRYVLQDAGLYEVVTL